MKGILAIYDAPKFGDRYTIYYDEPGSRAGFHPCLGASEHPFHPQGIGQHSEGQLGAHNGKRISFSQLPPDVQLAVKQDIGITSTRRNPKAKQRYQWYEGASAYYIVDTKTNEEACMGDGVDMFYTESDRAISPGTIAFDRAMDYMFRHEQSTLGEAYFRQYE